MDQYLDYWMTCEILTSHLGPDDDDEPQHSKIARSLALHVGREKADVENALGLREIAATRTDIVHGRRDDVPDKEFSLLMRVARELLQKELGLGYVPTRARPLETAFTVYEEAKVSKAAERPAAKKAAEKAARKAAAREAMQKATGKRGKKDETTPE